MRLPGDDFITDPKVQTDHAVTIEAPPSSVWPWLVHRGGDAVGGTRLAGSTAFFPCQRTGVPIGSFQSYRT